MEEWKGQGSVIYIFVCLTYSVCKITGWYIYIFYNLYLVYIYYIIYLHIPSCPFLFFHIDLKVWWQILEI